MMLVEEFSHIMLSSKIGVIIFTFTLLTFWIFVQSYSKRCLLLYLNKGITTLQVEHYIYRLVLGIKARRVSGAARLVVSLGASVPFFISPLKCFKCQ